VASGTGPDHFLPVVAVNREGVVGIMWYDRRDVADGMGWDLRFTASLDGGETFLPSVPVSTVPIRFTEDLRLVSYGFVDNRKDRGHGPDLQVNVEFHQLFAGDTAGMAADAAGVFHPMWSDHRTGAPQLWTAAVTVNGKGLRHGSPGLASLDDVSSLVTMEVLSTAYDQKTRDVAVTIALKNTSSKPIPQPLKVRILRLTTDVGSSVQALDAENSKPGPNAVWTFAGDRELKPNESTVPRTLHFRLAEPISYKTGSGFNNRLVRLQARILGHARL
jgi:hypothetical protein